METDATIAALIFLAAVLYSSVGHAGASAYLAVMAFFGVAPDVMRPSALVLNIIVASIALGQFRRAGALSWPLVRPFALGSVPAALVGGTLTLPAHSYRAAVGAVLLYSAYRSVRSRSDGHAIRPAPLAAALLLGAVIGLLSGLTGIGGGVLLGPLLLTRHWAEPRAAAGASAALNLANSLAALAGDFLGVCLLPPAFPGWAVAAVAGAAIGSHLGARRLGGTMLRRVLAVVLVIAGLKLILS